VSLISLFIGGAIELAGARAPQNSDSGGTGGHNRIYGAPVKKIKRLMKKSNIQQRKCSACHPLTTDTLPLINSFVYHTVLCRRRQQLDTASVRRHPVSQSGKRNPESTPIFCSRLDSGLVHSSRWPKILKHFSKLIK